MRPVSIAILISWPITYYSMSQWLQNFAYRISINVLTLVLAGILALGIALLAVLYHVLKTITANPVESLRYE